MKLKARGFLDIKELIDFVNNVLGGAPTKWEIVSDNANGGFVFVWEGA